MATAQRTPREIVEFAPNVPVTVALKYPHGKTCANGERVMFTTCDERTLFLDLEVANRVEQLGVNVRENFTITKRTDGKRGSPVTWEVARTVGEQPNGTLVVPKPPASAGAAVPVRSGLVDEAKALVDAYAEILAYGLTAHQGRVKPDEIRALTISAYIQRRQLSSVA